MGVGGRVGGKLGIEWAQWAFFVYPKRGNDFSKRDDDYYDDMMQLVVRIGQEPRGNAFDAPYSIKLKVRSRVNNNTFALAPPQCCKRG